MIYPGWVSTGITSRALKADGNLTGRVSVHEKNAMSAEACARIIIQAVAKRKREEVMTFMGKLGLWFRLITPGLVDQVVRKNLE